MAYLTKGRSVAVVEEVSYAAAAPVFTNGDYVDYTGGDISTSIEQLERAVVRDSMVDLEPLLGQETSSGSLTVEVSGDDAVNGVNGHLLYKNGVGKYIAKTVATTIASAVSATVFGLTSVAGLAAGQVIKVTLGTGAEFVTISSIVASTVTVTPALSATPVLANAVIGLATYILPRPADAVPSLAIRENLKPQSGNTIDYDYRGVMVSDVALAYPVGNIATAQFTVAGAGFDVASPGSTVTLPCTLFTPVVGKNAVLKVHGVAYTAQDVAINVSTETTDVNDITSESLSNKLGVKKTVTGSLRTEYVGSGNFSKFKAGDKGELILQLRDGGKTSPMLQVVYMPSVKFTEVTRSEDGGILYDNISFQALSVGCVGNEQAISIAFA